MRAFYIIYIFTKFSNLEEENDTTARTLITRSNLNSINHCINAIDTNLARIHKHKKIIARKFMSFG